MKISKQLIVDFSMKKYENVDDRNIYTTTQPFIVNSNRSDYIMAYISNQNLSDSVGEPIKDFYRNKDTWSLFNDNLSGDGTYIFGSGSGNSVSFDDIVAYIGDYSSDNNGDYPTLPQINLYIQTQNSDNNNPDSGGGSGGSGDDSGGIFDFLSNIGEVLGNLISNLGQVLADLISGVVEAVSSVLEAIPNVFTPLISYIFGWLPESVQALVVLGITAMLIIGIVKMIRG